VVHHGLFDDRYGCPDVVDVLRCNQCEHHFIDPLRPDRELGDLYRSHYGRDQQSPTTIPRLRKARFRRGTLPTPQILGAADGRRLLDVGCGTGEFLRLAQADGFRTTGIDVDPEAVAVARRSGVNAFVGSVFDNPLKRARFDVITLNQVIEHVQDPVETLASLRGSLTREGIIFLATPNGHSASLRRMGANWIHWHVPYHQHIFTPESLRIAARSAGLELLTQKSRTPLVWLRLQQQHLREPILNGTERWPWRGQPSVRRPRGSDTRDRIVAVARLSVSLIDDLKGNGDCIMTTLRQS